MIGFVPNAAFRAQVIAVSPVLKPIVDAYPKGQIPVDENTDQITVGERNTIREDSGMIRFDYRFSDKSTAYVRYNIDNAYIDNPSDAADTALSVNTCHHCGGANLSALEKERSPSRFGTHHHRASDEQLFGEVAAEIDQRPEKLFGRGNLNQPFPGKAGKKYRPRQRTRVRAQAGPTRHSPGRREARTQDETAAA